MAHQHEVTTQAASDGRQHPHLELESPITRHATKLAYVSIFDPTDIHAWSGLGVYIHRALQNAGLRTETIGSLRYEYDFIYKAKEVLYTRVLRKDYKMLWDSILLKRFAAQVDRALASSQADVVFSIWTNPIAYLRTKKPIVFWGDGTLAGLMEGYPGYQNLCAETIRDGHRAEQMALSKCRLAIYSSDWAAETAVRCYGADPSKVRIVPFGANIECDRDLATIRDRLVRKDFDVCRLLFIGKEWERKGGAVAVQVADRLNRDGIPAELHIVGCNPPCDLPSYVKVHGFLSKASEEGRRRLDELFSQAHFFILPTQADCTPVVFSEACSFGLPILTTTVGGIPTIIQNGKNGYTFPLDVTPDAYCNTIARLWSPRAAYEQLALSSFNAYTERLNWDVAGRRVAELIEESCG